MAEPELSKAELLNLFVSQLSDLVVVLLDPRGNFVSWNPGVEEHFGYIQEEFIGRNLDILLPAEEQNHGITKRELEQAASTGRASDTRWLMKKGGNRIFVEGFTLSLRDSGRLSGFGKVMRDVTERKAVENSLEAIAQALDQAVVIVRRLDGTIDHWTTGCERLYGWGAKEAVGHNCYELLQTKFKAPLEEIQRQFLKHRSWKGEVEQVRRDGTRISVATNWMAMSDDGDAPVSIIETQTDVTELLQMHKELEAANVRLQSMAEELERSNVELEEFARIASHDLSAPIISTRWLVDLLSNRYAKTLDKEGQKILQQVTQSLDRMADLVDGVLAHAQVGRSSIGTSEGVDATTALQTAMQNLRHDIETSKAKITWDPLPKLCVNSQALGQLFQNLLSNAIKYRRPDVEPSIKIGVFREGAMWLIGVEDNGTGIEREWFERIFQPMQRRHGSEISGSGIGLATCKKIVTRAGGKIWVESTIGKGSTFFFTLPGPPRDAAEIHSNQ